METVVDQVARRVPVIAQTGATSTAEASLSRIGAAVGTYLVPLALTSLGIGTTMIIAGGITLLGLVISLAWAPETRGLTLAQSAALTIEEDHAARPV